MKLPRLPSFSIYFKNFLNLQTWTVWEPISQLFSQKCRGRGQATAAEGCLFFTAPAPHPLPTRVSSCYPESTPAHWWVECDPIPPQKLEDLLLGTFKENLHFFLSFLLYSFYSLSHTKNRKERKEKERQENQWEDRKFVLQMIFLFILGSFKHPATLLLLQLELNPGLLLHSHRAVSKNTFFFSLQRVVCSWKV